MPTLSNDHLAIRVNLKGAELSSVISRKSEIEYIWQADPNFWGRHAPVLFPIVGRLKEDQYTFLGETYSMKQHGLARNLDFVQVDEDKGLAFILSSDEETEKSYPFSFEFKTQYELEENRLTIHHEVRNKGQNEMFFSLGAHPAFNVPMGGQGSYEDYEIYFENSETLDRYLLEGGLYTGETRRVLTNSHVLPLTGDMFDRDAIVFQRFDSNSIVLRSKLHDHKVTLGMEGFPYLGIWAKPGADFVCLEPWQGLADFIQTNGDLSQKIGIMNLGARDTYRTSYQLTFD